MSNQTRKVRTWFIPIFMLASLLCAGDAVAQDKGWQPAMPETGKGQDKDKTQKRVGSIFDDQADEFEEPTYTPPADIEEKIKAIPPIPGNIKKHLTEKYTRIDDPYSTLQQTPYGPSGKIYILGDLTSKTIDETSPFKEALQKENKEERTRALAKAIIAEEVSILGIPDLNELKERKFYTDEYGHITIYYDRYIGDLPLEYGDVAVSFRHGETIKSLRANVVAPPPALYQAAAKKTLGRGKIFRIIGQELKTTAGGNEVGMGVTKVYKVAIPKAPYVIWKVSISTVDNAWNYKIDAFTGEILDKQSAMRPTR